MWNSIRGLSIGLSTDTFSPNGDGHQDSVTISYRLGSPAKVKVEIVSSSGSPVRALVSPTVLAAGVYTTRWDGRNGGGERVSDGQYSARVTATVSGSPVSDSRRVWVNTALGRVSASASTFSPVKAALIVHYSLARGAKVTVRVTQGSRVVRTLTPPTERLSGTYAATWDGKDSRGSPCPEGGYSVRVSADTAAGRSEALRDVYLDRSAPALTNARLSTQTLLVNGATAQVWSYYLSEQASVRLDILSSGRVVKTIGLAMKGAGRS
ncbi:MAG: hypothetical protein M3281_09770, partial [Chloroflexota bacterium]|nr:hypothetical protein [Chloroflexota bacterium]